MGDLASLEEFRDYTRRVHSSYTLANAGLEELANSIKGDTDYSHSGLHEIYDEKNGALISAIPYFHVMKGMKRDGPISQTIAHGMICFIYFS